MIDRKRAARWGGLAVNVLLGTLFVAAGLAKLAATEFEVQGFAHFGYAPWFMYAIGALELGGGLLLLLPRTAPWGAVLMLPVMVGALCTHVATGDPVSAMVPAAVVLVLLLGRLWFADLFRRGATLRSFVRA